MALVHGAFPYDINNLLGGAVRVLLAPYVVGDIPASPLEAFDQVSPYDANTPFVDLGGTKEDFSYGRNIDVSGYQIQQLQGNVIEEVTDATRTIKVSMAEIGAKGLEIIEQSAAPEDIAAATLTSAYEKVSFGTISDLKRYIAVFVARRSQASGLVLEGAGGLKRGRFVVGVGYNVAISADNVEVGIGKGNLAAAQVTFKFFPEPSFDQGEEFGGWFFEKAGTIALT